MIHNARPMQVPCLLIRPDTEEEIIGSRYELIWSVVRQIPRGTVATYGQIAEIAGLEGHARQVGYALHHLPDESDVPWHRVVNARGEISPRSAGDSHELQKMLLESEGIVIVRGRIDLARYRWKHNGSPTKRHRPA